MVWVFFLSLLVFQQYFFCAACPILGWHLRQVLVFEATLSFFFFYMFQGKPKATSGGFAF